MHYSRGGMTVQPEVSQEKDMRIKRKNPVQGTTTP